MCGIAGEIDLNRNLKVNKSFLSSLSHRGPHNQTSLKLNENFCLYHTRLKIIDLSNQSNQPMTTVDKRYTISYNGELYNYKKIRSNLKLKGYTFSTEGDTEVFLKGFAEYGNNFFKIANGIFAVAIFDKKEKKLTLARDFIGVKPLYYSYDKKKFLFASELKTISNNLNFKPNLNKKVLNEFLIYKYISGDETLVKNIFKIDPGKIYTIDLKKKNISINISQYYKFKEVDNSENILDAKERTRELLRNSVKLQTQSDANLGVQLSGGVDSTLITELAMQERNIHNIYFSTFKNFKKDEYKYANFVSKKLDINFKKIELTKKYFMKNFLRSIYYLDEPLNHPHSVAIKQISKAAKKNVSVILAGEGADEIFFGYERYMNIFPSTNKQKILENGAFLRTKSDLHLYNLFSSRKYGNPHHNRRQIYDKINVNCNLKKFQLFESKTHLQSLLLRSDKMMMSNSIEARVPYLDLDLFNYSLNISAKIKKNKEQKILLKKILQDLGYPIRFTNRKKIGYIVPYNNWLISKKNFKKEIHNEILLSLFDRKSLNLLENNLQNNKNIYSNAKIYWLLNNLQNFISIFKLNF